MLTIETLYNHTFTISRPSRTPDGQGGWTVSYTEIGTVRGRLRPVSASAQTVADQQQASVTHILYCPADSNIRRGDLVSGAGNTVEVLAIREPSHAGHHWEVDCQEVQKEAEEQGS